MVSTRLVALGRTVDEYQGNFVLHYRNNRPLYPDRYPIERLIAGEVFDDVVVVLAHKDNPDRDWAHRIRSLIITDNTAPGLLVLIVHDASAQVEAEDRFERTFGANPAPALIFRLTDLRFIKVNEGFLQLTGFRREEVLGRSIFEVDVLGNAERRDLALERLRAGETIPQMEASLTVPSDPAVGLSRGWPAHRDRRRALHAVHLRGSRAAPEGRDGPAPTPRSALPRPSAWCRSDAILRADDRRLVEVNDAFRGFYGLPDPGRGWRSRGPAPLGRRGERELSRRGFAEPAPCRD